MPKYSTIKRELFRFLYYAGGDPEQAWLLQPTAKKGKKDVPKYTVGQYEKALQDPEYAEYRERINKQRRDNAEGQILCALDNAQRMLHGIDSDDPNFASVAKHYREMERLYAPIAERLAVVHIESEKFDNLIIAIPGAEPPADSDDEK